VHLTARLICTVALSGFSFASAPLVAQVAPNLTTGPRDVLYAQEGLLRSFDETWNLTPSTSDTLSLPALEAASLAEDGPAPNNRPADPPTKGDLQAKPQDALSRKSMRFRWMPAIGESLLYTGIMHTFDIISQPGTRDALNGHWFQQYTQSVSELRGWSDNDMFMAPYVGHPLEGSIFGFIERQNDPKYKLVQWGDGREYWISLLRSMAYSAVWHTQWKIGPISEASIANVMIHASPGFICLADTPTLGFVVMMAEDVADRYAIMGLENRSTNRPLIILARSFLNPGRTFANMMAFKVPWQRETRMGLFGENYEFRKQLVEDFKNGSGEKPFVFEKNAWMPPGMEVTHTHPKEADIELTAFPY